MNSRNYVLLALAILTAILSFTTSGLIALGAIIVASISSVLLIAQALFSAYRAKRVGALGFAAVAIVILGMLLYGLRVLATIH